MSEEIASIIFQSSGNGSWSPKGDLGLLGDLFLKTGLLWVSFLSKSLLFGRKLSKYGSFKGFRQNRWRQEYGAKVSKTITLTNLSRIS